MEREKQIDQLNRVLHGTVNSVVQYIPVSTPFVPEGFEPRLEELERLRDEEARTAQRLVDAIHARDGVPRVGVFPYWNVDLNYLDIRFMARFGAEHLTGVVEELEANLDEAARHDPELRRLFRDVLEEKRAHLAKLRQVAGEGEGEGEGEDDGDGKPEHAAEDESK